MAARLSLAILAGWILVAASPSGVSARIAAGDLATMQGAWQVASHETAGKKADEEELKKADLQLAITRTKFQYTSAGKPLAEGTFTLDLKAKSIEADGKTPDCKEVKTIGIYKLEKDTLTVCYVPDGEKRPKEFKSEEGSKTSPIVCKRVKK